MQARGNAQPMQSLGVFKGRQNPRRTVIVVDDDAILREVMAEQLAGLGWRVLAADNGETAIDVL